MYKHLYTHIIKDLSYTDFECDGHNGIFRCINQSILAVRIHIHKVRDSYEALIAGATVKFTNELYSFEPVFRVPAMTTPIAKLYPRARSRGVLLKYADQEICYFFPYR